MRAPIGTLLNHLYRLTKKTASVNSLAVFVYLSLIYSIMPVQLILAPAAPLG